MARAAPPPPPRYFALDVLVAVEEAAREARERGERADRHDETKKGALADHDACPFERGSAHEVRRAGDCSPVLGHRRGHVVRRKGVSKEPNVSERDGFWRFKRGLRAS